MRKLFLTFVYLLLTVLHRGESDKPCSERQIKSESVVCVCNEEYCDELVRVSPSYGQFISYTTSKGGLRFSKSVGYLESSSNNCCSTTLTVEPEIQYQTILGFGGAVTDAAGINWKNLSEPLQAHLIKSYFGNNGLEYTFIRVPIGGSDFSTHAYGYNELPENDETLSNFTLSDEDFNYKLPMIKAAMEAADERDVNVLATCWSPPLWMKTRPQWAGFSRLKEQYLQTYADYHLKFLQKYKEQGVNIWGLTTTNEPLNGVIAVTTNFNSLGWLPSQMAKYIVENLGPTIRNSEFRQVKILGHDDQRAMLPLWFDVMVKKNLKVLEYIDGIGVHYYTDFITPASVLNNTVMKYSGKFLLATEACEGSFPWQLKKVLLGSWDRAVSYTRDILEDLNHGSAGWIDWNLCLNTQGGPNWAKNFVDSPIIVLPENGEFVKQPMFYALGHFSKFVPPESKRIKITEKKSFFDTTISNSAFLTPRNTVVVILFNKGKSTRKVAVRLGSQQAKLSLDENSITTVEFPYKST